MVFTVVRNTVESRIERNPCQHGYNDFLDIVIGVHDPFKQGTNHIWRHLSVNKKEAGVNIPM